jgi:hypothetical protein
MYVLPIAKYADGISVHSYGESRPEPLCNGFFR